MTMLHTSLEQAEKSRGNQLSQVHIGNGRYISVGMQMCKLTDCEVDGSTEHDR